MTYALSPCQIKLNKNKVPLNDFDVKFNLIDMKESFGVWLKHLRDQHGYSMQALADRSGVTKATISLLENDKMEMPRIDGLERIGKTLGVPAKEVRRQLAERLINTVDEFYELADGVRVGFDSDKYVHEQQIEIALQVKGYIASILKDSNAAAALQLQSAKPAILQQDPSAPSQPVKNQGAIPDFDTNSESKTRRGKAS